MNLLNSIWAANTHKYQRWMVLVVLIVAVGVYLNTLFLGFVWDDINLIVKPSPLRSLENIPYFFKNSVSSGQQFSHQTPYYRPVFSVSMALDHHLWGISSLGYHLTNVLLHGVVSVLVFFLSRRILQSAAAALIAALVYALHPVHAEAVAYIGARNELLCGLFMSASFLVYVKFREQYNILSATAALLLFFAALLSKEMAIALPLLILFYEASLGHSTFKKSILRAMPFFMVLAGYLVLRSNVLTMTTWDGPPLSVRIFTSFGIVASYFWLLLFPFTPKTFYDIPIKWSLLQADVLVPASILLLIIIVGIIMFKRDRVVSFSIAWIYLALIPASGVPVLIMPAFMAERYLYIPSIGFSFICGWIVTKILDKQGSQGPVKPSPVFSIIVVALFAGYAYITYTQNYVWKDEPTLYKSMIANAPEHYLGYSMLGGYYGRNNQYGEMASCYTTSVALAKKRQLSLGDNYVKIGHLDRAEKALTQLKDFGHTDATVTSRLAAVAEMKRLKTAEH